MPSFIVTPEITAKISTAFNLTEEEVTSYHRMFQNKISKAVKRHYLAHTIRTMEEALRELPGNEMFRIVCSPVDENSRNLGITGAYYYKGRFFAIYYHPRTNEKQLRIMLAHELGHLFLLELINTGLGRDYNKDIQIEPMSTVMGIFTILDKNEFYHNKTIPFKHTSPEDVINDFAFLMNRQQP